MSKYCDLGHIRGSSGVCVVCDNLHARGVAVATYSENGHRPTPLSYLEKGVGQVLPMLSLKDLRSRHSGTLDWIIEGHLARGELVFIAGAGDSLKSWIVAHLAAAIDGHFQWMGTFDVKAERVIFLEQERAANLVYQLNRIEIAERITLGGDRLRIVPPTILPLSEDRSQLALRDTVAVFRPDVVIINALRDVLGRANENSPSDMAALLRSLGRIAEELNCCILVVDHFNKAGLTGIVRGNTAHAGTAQKHAEADAVLIAERPRDELGKGVGSATVSTGKRRGGEAGLPFAVSLTDTSDGGVLVRAEVGVKALSPDAHAVLGAIDRGATLVAEMVQSLGISQTRIYQALSELKAARQIESTGQTGKVHTYQRTPEPPLSPHKEKGVAGLAKYAVEELGLNEVQHG